MSARQLTLPLINIKRAKTYRDKLIKALNSDLDFHDQISNYASHDLHSFPAKFPPQLPRKFIQQLTDPGNVVLDPMVGSGTTIIEAYLNSRRGIGIDIDPLAIKISKVKTTPVNLLRIEHLHKHILREARLLLYENKNELYRNLEKRWDSETRSFINYWFPRNNQLELLALLTQIEKIIDSTIREFFELSISAIIITKSGGVSLALDLAHTRPHRAKRIFSKKGRLIVGEKLDETLESRANYISKTIRSPIEEFDKRVQRNLDSLSHINQKSLPPLFFFGNSQDIPLSDNCVDLIVTSPPYASNAIDYMRAHKFSLVWLGYPLVDLSKKRRDYIGGESIADFTFESVPPNTKQIISEISDLDEKKGKVLHRYYSEMTRSLKEMYRVLKPGKAAILVVGSSIMRDRDTQIQLCLAEIGKVIGFEVPAIGIRHLDRNRRMLPTGMKIDRDSQIQQRMHEEYVLGFYKPLE